MFDIGDIYEVQVYFDDDPNRYKVRPVLIVNNENENFTIAEITGSKPKYPPTRYDKYKEPIYKWSKAGLIKESYVKTHKVYNIEKEMLYKYIGSIDPEEYERILRKILKVKNRL